MDESRKQTYSFLLSAALLHVKWDLVASWTGLSLWRPWRLLRESHRVRRAAHRAVAFHNLAIFLTHDLAGFSEEMFWREIEAFNKRFPDDWADYRGMFDRKLAGEEVFIIKPKG
jgi:hypothetical protein